MTKGSFWNIKEVILRKNNLREPERKKEQNYGLSLLEFSKLCLALKGYHYLMLTIKFVFIYR